MDISGSQNDLGPDLVPSPPPEPKKEVCKICLKGVTTEPIIRCAKCVDCSLCIQCFSLGLETTSHRCDHPYRIDRRHIPTDNTDWTLADDYKVLQGVIECGYGSFVDISKKFPHRTAEDVEKRVEKLLGLDKAPLRCPLQVHPVPRLPYSYESIRENPPRFPEKSLHWRLTGGYSAPRGDFSNEHQPDAERSLNDLTVSSDEDDSDEELSIAINCALVECHNDTLRERERRKAIIKEHGLLLKNANFFMSFQRDPRLKIFTQLMNREDLDFLIQGFKIEDRLAVTLKKLKKYRRLGVKSLRGCNLYDQLEQMRNETLKNLRSYVPSTNVKRFSPQTQKTPQPLNIAEYPGYDFLTADEREFCSSGRVFPEKFLKAKQLFMEVSAQEGGLKLKTARQIMKMDVNKTRRVFNFLRDKNLIIALPSK